MPVALEMEITCINKEDRDDPFERITHVAGPQFSRITQEIAIGWIKSGYAQFFVGKGAFRVRVIIGLSAKGNEYLKAQNDGEIPNNLLSLPQCLSSGLGPS